MGDWIMIQRGAAEQVQAATREYLKLFPPQKPLPRGIEVLQDPRGFLVLRFSAAVPPFALVNLAGWLDAPPGQKGMGDARLYMTSPGSGTRFRLARDPSNVDMGDTFVGLSADDQQRIVVYLPECGVCDTSQRVTIPGEPDLDPASLRSLLRDEVVFDEGDGEFGNPQFVVTHERDHDWSRDESCW